MKIILVALYLYLFVSLQGVVDDRESRMWTSQRGSTIEAVFVEANGGRVALKREDGRLIRIGLDDLVKVDQEYILKVVALERKVMDEKRADLLKGRSRRKSSSTKDEKPEYMSIPEWEVLKENNLARENPEMYIKFLENYRRKHEGGNVFNTQHGHLMTKEGLAAVDEAISFLKRQPILSPIKPSAGLTRAARGHAEDIGVADIVGHTGSNGSSSRDRIEKHGRWNVTIGENIQFGEGDARDIIMQLIIDDGVPSRGHRAAIYTKEFKVAGVAIARHKTYTSCCVINYAGEFLDKRAR